MGGCVLSPPPPPVLPPEVPPVLPLDPLELAPLAGDAATTTVRVMTSGGGGATGEYRRMVKPFSGMEGTAAMVVAVVVGGVVVEGGASALDGSGASDWNVMTLVAQARAAAVQAAMCAQREGKSLLIKIMGSRAPGRRVRRCGR